MPLLALLLASAPTTFVNDLERPVTVNLYTGDAVWSGCVIRANEACVLLAEGDAQVKLAGAVRMSAFGHVGDRPRTLHIRQRFEDGPAILAGMLFMAGLTFGSPIVLIGLAIGNTPTALAGAGLFVAGTGLAVVALATAPPAAGHLVEQGVAQKLDALGVQASF